tara:strand:+ start:714 stop:989 length:276 start_codon:yes stop_codon:yes gene_type:complete
MSIINPVPQEIRGVHRKIKDKTHDYYWWKHNKSAEEQEKINRLQVISIDDLSDILGDFFKTQFRGFDKEALKKSMLNSTMEKGYWNTDDGN